MRRWKDRVVWVYLTPRFSAPGRGVVTPHRVWSIQTITSLVRSIKSITNLLTTATGPGSIPFRCPRVKTNTSLASKSPTSLWVFFNLFYNHCCHICYSQLQFQIIKYFFFAHCFSSLKKNLVEWSLIYSKRN